MDPIEFINARLDTEEGDADRVHDIDCSIHPGFADERGNCTCAEPARVLAQVTAMRAIVEFHESWPVLVDTPPEMSTATDDTGNMTLKMAKQVAWLTNQEYRKRFGDEPPTAPMVRHLAAIWASHPDYDSAWAHDA